MQICKLRTNHIKNPVGFALDNITLSYVVLSTGTRQEWRLHAGWEPA